ncbi:MAG: hypothetical protein HRU31_16885 [Rhodobacteraceae bacterium]|nr:hypothetical protein [Paracoccaceae bacterium]
MQTQLYGEITLTPSEIYTMESAPDQKIDLRIGADKMQEKYIEDIWVTVSEDSFGIVPLPIDAAAPPPDPISLYDLEAAFENLWDSIESRDSDQFDDFRDYFFGRLVINKECQQTITFDLGVDGSLAAQFDTWLSPVTAELALSGAIQSSTTFGAGREFRIERFNIGNRVYEVMDEAVAPDCISLDDQRRIRIASRRIVAQLNSSDAQDLQLKTDAKGRLIYSCRSEYQKIAQTLYDQELNEAPTRLLISQFTTFRDPGNVARCN